MDLTDLIDQLGALHGELPGHCTYPADSTPWLKYSNNTVYKTFTVHFTPHLVGNMNKKQDFEKNLDNQLIENALVDGKFLIEMYKNLTEQAHKKLSETPENTLLFSYTFAFELPSDFWNEREGRYACSYLIKECWDKYNTFLKNFMDRLRREQDPVKSHWSP